MGGKLLNVERVDRTRYEEILTSLKPVLDKLYGDKYRIPTPYRNKKTYGDVDILLDAAVILNNPKWREEVCEALGVTQSKKVQAVFSMLYMDFQVDIFLVGTSKLETAYNFMSYNILGNLIGRIYHKFDLRYGEDGLMYVLRGFNNHISKEVPVSRDMKDILEFVGLSYERWQEGFDDLEDIFKYVISSKYFCANSYDLKYFNIEKRAKERPDFMAFVNYVNDWKITKNYPFDREKKPDWLPFIDLYFGSNLQDARKKHLIRQETLKEVADKFNGKLIMEWIPGIDGRGIGELITAYKKEYGEHFDDHVRGVHQTILKLEVQELWKEKILTLSKRATEI